MPTTEVDDRSRRRVPTTGADDGRRRRMLTTDAGHERQATIRSTPQNKWMQQTRSAPWPAGGAALAADPCVLRTLRRRTTPTTDANGRMPTTDADDGCRLRMMPATDDADDGSRRPKPTTYADDGCRLRMPTTDAHDGCSRRMPATDYRLRCVRRRRTSGCSRRGPRHGQPEARPSQLIHVFDGLTDA